MAIIHFTAKDALQAVRPRITPDHSGDVNLHIESADDCEGVKCGGRSELALSSEDYAQWLTTYKGRSPMPPHSHLIVSGNEPATRETIFPIVKELP